jgi:vesicle coat complex subunit
MYYNTKLSSFDLTYGYDHGNHRPLVRRRALLAFRALSVYDPELMKRVISKVQKRLRDPDPSVVGAALAVSADVVCRSVAD